MFFLSSGLEDTFSEYLPTPARDTLPAKQVVALSATNNPLENPAMTDTSHLENLALWRVFFKLAEKGCFARAAIELNRPTSHVTRSIQALERALGEPLFDRTKRPVELTAKGRAAHALLRGSLRSFESKPGKLREPAEASRNPGLIRISGPVGFLRHFVSPFLGEPLRAFAPDVSVSVSADLTEEDVLAGRCDILISPLEPSNPKLTFFAGPSATTVVLASPEYLAAHGEPRTPAELSRHFGLLRSGHSFPQSRMLWRSGEGVIPEWRQSADFADMDLILDEAVRGNGITADLPVSMALEALRSGQLVPILEGWVRDPWSYRYIYRTPENAPTRAETVAMWLSTAVSQLMTERRDEGWRLVKAAYAARRREPVRA